MTPQDALFYAVAIGKTSPCAKSKRGVVIFNNEGVISQRCNEPALGGCAGTDACRAACNRICVHAEQDALFDALLYYGDRRPYLDHAESYSLLHVKVVDGEAVASGPPSCVECSKLILVSGIIERVWLLHEKGRVPEGALASEVSGQFMLVAYTAEHFHRLSLAHHHLPVFEGDPPCP